MSPDPTIAAPSARRWLRLAGRTLVALAFPPRCALCDRLLLPDEGADGLEACAACIAALPGIEHRCARCDALLPPGAAPGRGCAACRDLAAGCPLVVTVGPYEGGLGDAVRALKFRGRVARARTLGRLVGERVAARGRPLDGVALVPSVGRRDRARGYNHAREIARGAAERLGLPLWPDALARVRSAPRLTGLGRADRQAAVEGAFSASSRVEGQRVLLVDDVLTTGATLAACAEALRAAGAREVLGACAARRHRG